MKKEKLKKDKMKNKVEHQEQQRGKRNELKTEEQRLNGELELNKERERQLIELKHEEQNSTRMQQKLKSYMEQKKADFRKMMELK